MAVPLRLALRPADDLQRRARERFYGSLGVFIVTLPLPILLWAVSLDYATSFLQASASGSVEDQIGLAIAYRRLYGEYLGGLFFSATLAVNAALDLAAYVRSADRPEG